jgi:hypothetical protein
MKLYTQYCSANGTKYLIFKTIKDAASKLIDVRIKRVHASLIIKFDLQKNTKEERVVFYT